MNKIRSSSIVTVVVAGAAVVGGEELVVTDDPLDDVVCRNVSDRSSVLDVLDPQPPTINARIKIAVFLMTPVSPPSDAWLSPSRPIAPAPEGPLTFLHLGGRPLPDPLQCHLEPTQRQLTPDGHDRFE